MRKEITFGKLLGIIFCVLAAAGTVLLLLVSGYFSGQMKLIDKFCTTIERDDFESFKACFDEKTAETLTEADLTTAKTATVFFKAYPLSATNEVYSQTNSYLIDTDEFKTKADFRERQKVEKGKYFVTFDLTLYNDTDNTKLDYLTRLIVRQNGKWVFASNSEIMPLTEVCNGETGEMLRVLYQGTCSGNRAEYAITGDDILAESDTIGITAERPNAAPRTGFAGEFDFNVFGWNFMPINSGNCTITVDRYETGIVSYTDIYNVTVDENMKITYTMERTNIDGNKE